MKRVITLLLVIFSLSCSSITCMAAENSDILESPVYAIYHSSNIELDEVMIKNGKGALITQSGISLTLELDDKYNGYMLVVHPITERDKEAFEWVESCIPNEVAKYSSYDIYLLSPENDRVELPDSTLIQISVSNSSNSVIGLSCSGQTMVIKSSYEDEILKFISSDRANYYVICHTTSGVDVDLPKTGDTANMHLWIILLAISSIMLVIVIRNIWAIRKQQHRIF